MAAIEAFEAALKDVLKAKRISQSKMNTLTEAALKCMDNDVQMVSILYRTHRGLSPAAKGASLYAFDALARAARNRVVKNNLTADLSANKGNCATFLLRTEGVLDGLYRDLSTTDSDELKEKAKKILDIWTKQNTFSSAVLSPLYSVLEQAGKDKEADNADATNVASAEPVPPALPPADPTPQAPAVPPVDVNAVQSTLFALLSKAATVANTAAPVAAQTAPNRFAPPPAAPVPILDANQLALLHQLAQTAKGNAVPAQPIPVSASVVPSLTTPNGVPVVPPLQGPPQPQPLPYRDDHYGAPASAPRRESEHVRFDGPERGYPRDDYSDPRRGSRGGPRDRGRGGRGRGRWDDRDHFRDRSREFSRDPRPRRSRSRSPPSRYGGPGPRDARPHSPPPPLGRRGGYGQYGQRPTQGYGPGPAAQAGGEPESGKDEFGRDIRPESPRDSDTASVQAHQQRSASPLPPGTGSVTTSDRGSVASESANPAARAAMAGAPPPYSQPYPEAPPYTHSYSSGPPASPSISPSTSTAPLSPIQHRPGAGAALEGFDRASFDPSDPASWETLGKAWTATHASMPTQEQLMQFVFSAAAPPAPQQASGSYGVPPPQQQQHYHQRFQSPPPSQPPPLPPRQYSQSYDDGGSRQWQGPDRQQWNDRSQEPRGRWRGGPDRGRGGGRDRFGGEDRARGRGRGDFGRGGYGHGDSGRRGFGPEDRGRGDYGHGNGRGAYNAGGAGHHEQDTDAVMLGGGDDHSWQEPQGHRGPLFGRPPQEYEAEVHRQPQPPFQAQPAFQPHPQGRPEQPYTAPPQSSHDEGGEGGGGGSSGRMQRVGDKWVFVRGAA